MILVSASLPNMTPKSIAQLQAARKQAYRGGWANAPSGGAPLPGVTIQKTPAPYKTRGFGSNTGG
jgi:hypothetical protein